MRRVRVMRGVRERTSRGRGRGRGRGEKRGRRIIQLVNQSIR